MRLARIQAHKHEYAATLEVKIRQPTPDPTHLQRLMLGLVGDPLRAKRAKEAVSILRGMFKASSSSLQTRRPSLQSATHSVQCYTCAGWGHIACDCKPRRGGPARGRQRPRCNSVNQAIVRFVVNTFPLFVLTCLFFVLGWDLCPCPVDLGGRGASQCLNSGRSSEPGVNKRLGSLFPLSGVCFSLFSFSPRYVLGKLSLVCRKT